MSQDVDIRVKVVHGTVVVIASTGSAGPDALDYRESGVDILDLEEFVEELAKRNKDMTDEELEERLKTQLFTVVLNR